MLGSWSLMFFRECEKGGSGGNLTNCHEVAQGAEGFVAGGGVLGFGFSQEEWEVAVAH